MLFTWVQMSSTNVFFCAETSAFLLRLPIPNDMQLHMSHVMRKPVYAICEQQRRRSDCAYAFSLIGVFVVRCLDTIIPLRAKAEISIH